jgi:membrane protease YdiL (CAAX protease family)
MTKKTQPPPNPRRQAEPAVAEHDAFGYPTLRSAAWLFLIVFVLSAVVIVGVQTNIDVRFLRLVSALILAGGGTLLTIFLTNVPFGVVLGRGPRVGGLVIGVSLGVLLWLPVSWLLIVMEGLLTNTIGPLQPPVALQSNISLPALLIQFGLLVPLCVGFLFWGYIQRAARALGDLTGATFAAILFALYGLVTTEFGTIIIPAHVVLGLTAAFAAHYTRSAWVGIAVLVGYNLTRALFENSALQVDLFNALGSRAEDLLDVRWLFAVLVTAFVAFGLVQILRALNPRNPGVPNAYPRRWWWLPVALALVICLFIAYGELNLRYRPAVAPPPDGGSTAPPR